MAMQNEPECNLWLSLVITCMGRLDHLRQTIPSLVTQCGQTPGVEIILVDWSCPDHSGAYAHEHWPEVRVVETRDHVFFHKSAALNAGVRIASAPWVAIFDADMIAAAGFFAEVKTRLRPDLLLGLSDERLAGFLLCSREAFDRAGGYDERMEGWGFEDDDMRRRLLEQGLRLERLPPHMIQVIPHDNELRTRFYAEKDPSRSALFNQALVWQARWTELSQRREQWPARPLLVPSGSLFRSIEFSLHLQWRLGVPGVRLLCATASIEQEAQQILDIIDSPGPVELIREPCHEPTVQLSVGQWHFPYFPARTCWKGWPQGRAYRRVAVEGIHPGELERLAGAAPHSAITRLDAAVPIATAAQIISESDVLISRGGGLVHLASAMGAPIFLLADDTARLSTLFNDNLDLDVLVCHSFEDLVPQLEVFLGTATVAAD